MNRLLCFGDNNMMLLFLSGLSILLGLGNGYLNLSGSLNLLFFDLGSN